MWRVLFFVFALGWFGFQLSTGLGLALWGLLAVLGAGWVAVLLWQIATWAPPRR